jgi:hypothetical protein
MLASVVGIDAQMYVNTPTIFVNGGTTPGPTPIPGPSTGTIPGTIQQIGRGVIVDNLAYPSGLAVDAAGNLYFGNVTFGPIRVELMRRTPQGTVTSLGTVVDTSAGFVAVGGWAFDVAVDASDHIFYNTPTITDGLGNVIVTGTIRQYGEPSPIVSALDYPTGLAVDRGGALYFGNQTFGPIRVDLKKRELNGSVSSLGTVVDTSAGGVAIGGWAFDVAVDAQGRVFYTTPTVTSFIPGQQSTIVASGSIRQVGVSAPIIDDLAYPSGLQVDAAGNLILTNVTLGPIRAEAIKRSAAGAVASLGIVLDTSAGSVALGPWAIGVTAPRCAAARPVLREIPLPDLCGPFNRGESGGVIEFSNGEKLEARCEGSFLSPAYVLWHTTAWGQRDRISQCVFAGGQNAAILTAIADTDNDDDDKLDCLISTDWQNLDGGANDGQNGASGLLHGATVITTPEEPYLDGLVFSYDANANKLSWQNIKFDYPPGQTSVPREEVWAYVYAPGRLPVPNKGTVVDPMVGPETEAMFEHLSLLLQDVPSETMSARPICDVDFDGACDALDRQLFEAAQGLCAGGLGFLTAADLDRDGCISDLDIDGLSDAFDRHGSPTDTVPPAIQLTVSAATLWPPNGQMVALHITGTINDELGEVNGDATAYRVVDEYGLVQPTGSVLVAPNGSYAFTIHLQASRRGEDQDGREYRIVVSAADKTGNAATASAIVRVPHDRRQP